MNKTGKINGIISLPIEIKDRILFFSTKNPDGTAKNWKTPSQLSKELSITTYSIEGFRNRNHITIPLKICEICKQSFQPKTFKQRVCYNKGCMKEFKRSLCRKRNEVSLSKNCKFCGKLFSINKSNQRYCSSECRNEGYKQKVREWIKKQPRPQTRIIICGKCGNKFEIKRTDRQSRRRFCDNCKKMYGNTLYTLYKKDGFASWAKLHHPEVLHEYLSSLHKMDITNKGLFKRGHPYYTHNEKS